MADRVPLLDLSTKIKRQIVRIDGVAYEMRTSNDLVLKNTQDFERSLARIHALLKRMQIESLPDDEAKELTEMLREMARLALNAPAKVIDRLGDMNLVVVFDAFFKLLLPSLKAARAQLLAPGPVPNGARSFQGSHGSMAGRRMSGRVRSR